MSALCSSGPAPSSEEATAGQMINSLPDLHLGRKFTACESVKHWDWPKSSFGFFLRS